jgi:hypothetical protein
MRKLLFIVIILFSLMAKAENPISFSEVIQVEGTSKDIIYNNIMAWIGDNYNSPKDVISISDKSSGLIVLNGTMNYKHKGMGYLCYEGWVDYSIKIQIKDNRFKVTISNFIHHNLPRNSDGCNLGLITEADVFTKKGMQKAYNNKVWGDIKMKAKDFSDSIILNLENINFSQDESW